jgi:hypothetical protein
VNQESGWKNKCEVNRSILGNRPTGHCGTVIIRCKKPFPKLENHSKKLARIIFLLAAIKKCHF